MSDKKSGYQFTIFDQISDNAKRNNVKEFQNAISKIESEYNEKIAKKLRDIKALRDSDPDDMDAETRRDIRYEERELKDLESERDEKIAKILDQQKSM